MKDHHHKEFYQQFGNIFPKRCHFHYCLTRLRSYVKLIWDIELSELCKSKHNKNENFREKKKKNIPNVGTELKALASNNVLNDSFQICK